MKKRTIRRNVDYNQTVHQPLSFRETSTSDLTNERLVVVIPTKEESACELLKSRFLATKARNDGWRWLANTAGNDGIGGLLQFPLSTWIFHKVCYS